MIKINNRQKIIHNNFFSYLDQKGVTQTKYAKDNNIDRSLLSKWKTLDSRMSAEQIYEASIYLDIPVNDLYYTNSEKKKLLVSSDTNYDPIIATQSIDFKYYHFDKKTTSIIIGFIVFVSLIFSLLSFILIKESNLYYTLYIILIPSLSYIVSRLLFTKKTYLINYLDDIYYYRIKDDNKYYKRSILIKVIYIILTFVLSTIIITNVSDELTYLVGLIILLITFDLFIKVSDIFLFSKKLKKQMYDKDFLNYQVHWYSHVFSTIMTGLSSTFILKSRLLILIPIIITMFILITYNTFIVTKIYSDYKVYYKEDDLEHRELFRSE